MKKVIERLKEEVSQPTCKLMQKVCAYISIDDAQKIIEFYDNSANIEPTILNILKDHFEDTTGDMTIGHLEKCAFDINKAVFSIKSEVYTESELTCKSGCMGSCGQCKDEPLPNVPDLTPQWDEIPEGFDFVAIDEDGEEHAFTEEPFHMSYCWIKGENVFTGRKFNMSSIDWKQTLSKRPK